MSWEHTTDMFGPRKKLTTAGSHHLNQRVAITTYALSMGTPSTSSEPVSEQKKRSTSTPVASHQQD